MKPTYSPRYVERENFYNLSLLLAKDSLTGLLHTSWKVKILIIPFILLAHQGMAQQLLSFRGPSAPSPALTINNDSADNNNTTSLLAAKKPMNFISNNESKAKSMITAYFKGVDDADSNYRTKKSNKAIIFFSTLVGGPIIGLIPTAICSAAKPTNNTLNIPNSPMVSNDAYMKGYKNEAHYIKKHNTWPVYILASVIWVAAANMILR